MIKLSGTEVNVKIVVIFSDFQNRWIFKKHPLNILQADELGRFDHVPILEYQPGCYPGRNHDPKQHPQDERTDKDITRNGASVLWAF